METRQIKRKVKKPNKLELKHILYIISFLLVLNIFQTCGINSKIKKNTKNIDIMKLHNQNFKKYVEDNIVIKDAFMLHNQMLRYEIVNDVLYDQNAIVRTKFRPDDRMRFYQLQKDSIRKNLKQFE